MKTGLFYFYKVYYKGNYVGDAYARFLTDARMQVYKFFCRFYPGDMHFSDFMAVKK